jgi:hypothetical protein
VDGGGGGGGGGDPGGTGEQPLRASVICTFPHEFAERFASAVTHTPDAAIVVAAG